MWVLLVTLLLMGEHLFGQDSRGKGWTWWLSQRNRDQTSSLLILPNASETAERDRAREGAKQRAEDRLFLEKTKYQRLLFYRSHRDQRVSLAIAAALEVGSVAPPQPRTPAGTTGSAIPGRPTDTPRIPDSEPPTASSDEPQEDPSLTSNAADAVDDVVDRVTARFMDRTAGPPERSAIFVLLIVGMFLVPAVAITFLILAVSHVRARLWGRALVFASLGGLVAWGAVSAARELTPDAPDISPAPPLLEKLSPWSESPRGEL